MNETIKTYTKITVEEAGEMLRDNGWKPVSGLAFLESNKKWNLNSLTGIKAIGECPFLSTLGASYKHCAKVTEIDPCKTPEGCPELEPWMAYVGDMWEGKEVGRNEPSIYWIYSGKWESDTRHCGLGQDRPYAIDVRTEWAQEHFPEFCRIRNYQEPEDEEFEMWFDDKTCDGGYMTGEFIEQLKSLTEEAYKLGQQNPTK